LILARSFQRLDIDRARRSAAFCGDAPSEIPSWISSNTGGEERTMTVFGPALRDRAAGVIASRAGVVLTLSASATARTVNLSPGAKPPVTSRSFKAL
jgi:hypothetical protein